MSQIFRAELLQLIKNPWVSPIRDTRFNTLKSKKRNITTCFLVFILTTVLTPDSKSIGITDPNAVIPLSPVGVPVLNVPFLDNAFNQTSVTRITNKMMSNQWAAHTYSQLQAFSPDNTHLILIENGFYVIKNRTTLMTTLELNSVMIAGNFDVNAPRWHPTMDNTIVAYDSNADSILRVIFIDVITGSASIQFTFPAIYTGILSSQSFDELSHDGRWMTGMATTSDGDAMIFSIDLVNGSLGTQMRLTELYNQNGGGEIFEPDWIGVSALGNFLSIQWVRDIPGARLSGLEIYNIEDGAFIQQVNPLHDHGDFGLDSNGNEVFVSTILSSPEDNNLPAIVSYSLPLSANDPQLIRTVPWETVWHISCQGPRNLCVISSGDTTDGGGNFRNEVFIQNLDGTVRRLTHHRSSLCGYWVQPRSSISKNGKYIIFDSDFFADGGINSCLSQGSLGGGDVFIIELPDENSLFNNGFE